MTLLVLLFACSSAEPVALAPAGVPFPHAAEFKEPTKHGPQALEFGTDACLGCHQEGATAPACASCHDVYPHETGWLNGAEHGKGMSGEAGPVARETCTACHGAEGLKAPDCTSCHASWPHPEGWKEAGNHGTYALARGGAVAACGSCHGADLAGADLTGADKAPSCSSCHKSYPHAAGWAEPTLHGATTDFTECWLCHGDGGATGGTADVTCQKCHSTFPHPADWSATHYATASKLGEAVCLGCHAAGFAPIPIVASCGATCHGAPQ
ncbi:hypothetical protein LBMAG42_23460 [Deltaproteobacteria bacterium]|nr:hypothetical protein LBMAG42_23460 [Deltaproteobacteria bacterium]